MKLLLDDIHLSKNGRLKKNIEYIVVAVAAAIFTFYHAILTSLVIARIDSLDLSFLYIFAVEWAAFLPLGLAMVAVIWVGKRRKDLFFNLTLTTVITHLVVASIIFVIHSFWQIYINSIFLVGNVDLSTFRSDFMSFLEMRYLVYITMIGLVGGLLKLREQTEISEKASMLSLELQKVRLKEIELKMNPEIIYPNLEFIKKRAIEKPEEASQMVILMAGLLRKLVDNIGEEKVRLNEEVLLFRMYMDLVKLRLSRTIDIKAQLKKLGENYRVPSMVFLIPLFEELFFGSYKIYTEDITSVFMYAEKKSKTESVIKIVLNGLSTKENLQEYLDNEPLFESINKLIGDFADEKFVLSAVVEEHFLTLKINSYKAEVVESH
ncbi:MAG: histidine kinase [Balneolaceae bacterium]